MCAALDVFEIFCSIQGESTFAGLPCAFVRLAGCPLECAWCDTLYAKAKGVQKRVGEVVAAVVALGVPLVEVTGGEPLAQPAAGKLIHALCDAGLEVLVETSGAFDISVIDSRAHVIMDIKCPSSGMSERMRHENLALLLPKDEIKLVIADRADYEFLRNALQEHELAKRCTVLVSTVAGAIEPKQVVEWILADRLPVRFQLQLHKWIWPPDQRGV
ncbi:MAG: radical SAM protein [Myxococcota bacterium]|jgi:7-carboxy-7-deazaguanine synthase|nr:radical SAM protein [Myxococcota bacterium]